MKFLAYGFLIVLFLTNVNKCEKGVDEAMASLGETFELEMGKTILMEGEKIGITFTNNTEGRCPLNVTCMRAGEAKATLKIQSKSSSEEVVLEAKGNCEATDGSCGETKSAMGYNIQLFTVNPYPGSDAAKNKEAVKVKLKISK